MRAFGQQVSVCRFPPNKPYISMRKSVEEKFDFAGRSGTLCWCFMRAEPVLPMGAHGAPCTVAVTHSKQGPKRVCDYEKLEKVI